MTLTPPPSEAYYITEGGFYMLDARVTRVVDGDTIEVTATIMVRMDFINAPETRGAERLEGIKVKNWLINRLKQGDLVELDIKTFDMYQRALAVVYKDGVNVNGEMLEKGLVEVYAPGRVGDGKYETV